MHRTSLFVALILAGATPAGADPVSTIQDLELTRNGTTLTVSGLASVVDASAAVVGTDPSGDAFQSGIGADVTEASIARVGGNALRFALKIADPMPQVFTIPEVVHYHWQITVVNGDIAVHYLLQAMRTGQYERTLPSAEPLFRVNSCAALASGAPNCFEVAGYVQGTMADGRVEWVVPRGLIGAFSGSTIALGPNGLRVVPGASGAAYGGQTLDSVGTEAYVVGPAVALGIRYQTDDPSTLVYATPAALGPDGSFVAKLGEPAFRGRYVIGIRACNGDGRTCGYAEIPYEVT